MTTAAARITAVSGLTGVSASAHLRQLAGTYGIAGAMLVAFSGLPSATAAQHLQTSAIISSPFIPVAPQSVMVPMDDTVVLVAMVDNSVVVVRFP
jgi:hypothetical protein